MNRHRPPGENGARGSSKRMATPMANVASVTPLSEALSFTGHVSGFPLCPLGGSPLTSRYPRRCVPGRESFWVSVGQAPILQIYSKKVGIPQSPEIYSFVVDRKEV